ncbi:hypothetical protein BRPE64_BCDS06620 [Caballeronia insecticola]|uniref:Uncharacterized protein n=1 Tax=Caballeronia insecticola TaxID=758793 RepID=R4WL91_9BURK|nr:hypothetical protein BRPE64_BCDS06620 [Caballeronia insecticola]
MTPGAFTDICRHKLWLTLCAALGYRCHRRLTYRCRSPIPSP